MKPLHVEQSLPLCCSLAALGGILEVAATAVTAVPAVREKQGIQLQWWVPYLAIAGNVGLQAIGSILSHLIATWFGPVSLVVPFFYSATLLSNMMIFGLLGERFTKNMRVGTHVIVVAVILLPVVGPNIQEGQSVASLFQHWYAIAWFVMLLVACAITGILLAVLDLTKYPMKARVTILLIARASAISVNLTVSRAFILGLSDAVLMTFVIIKIVSGVIYTYGIVVQSYAVEQARFVPLNATSIIIANALTGIILWEDWRVVASWYGYICIFVLLGLGCDLLLSVPLLNAENPEFGATQSASLILRKSSPGRRRPGSIPFKQLHQRFDPTSPIYYSIPTKRDGRQSYSAPPANGKSRRSKVDAWKELVGTHGEDKEDDEHEDSHHDDNCDNGVYEQQRQDEGSEGMPTATPSNYNMYMTPQGVGNAIEETALLLAHQPIHLGEKLAKAATAVVQGSTSKPKQDSGDFVPVHPTTHPEQHRLSRRAAWREVVSPMRSAIRSSTTAAGTMLAQRVGVVPYQQPPPNDEESIALSMPSTPPPMS